MSNQIFRLSWEQARNLQKYSDADPTLFKNTTQIVPNSEIPDEDWSPISKLDTNPWGQFNQLKAWAESDRGFIRNVTLDELSVIETVIRRHYPDTADQPEAAPFDIDQEDDLTQELLELPGVFRINEDESYGGDGHYPKLTDCLPIADVVEFILSRASQPVQVEVTKDMVERAAIELYREVGKTSSVWPKWNEIAEARRETYRTEVRVVLSATLGVSP